LPELPDYPDGVERWAAILGALEDMLQALWDAPGAARLAHSPTVPEAAGMYLFLEDGQPMYVGQSRNLRQRLANHCRPSSGHNKASFAFNLARRELEEQGHQLVGSREAIENLQVFLEPFRDAKKRLDEMEVRYVTCNDPELRTVFEVYAAERLNTKTYNTFETH